jgi:glycosyltransferase involved in cell wall biosynthesis
VSIVPPSHEARGMSARLGPHAGCETSPVGAAAIRALFVGAFTRSGGSRAITEDLAERLARRGAAVTLTSRAHGRLARVAEIVATVWRARNEYDVAQVDVYSGAAFRWAEAACLALRCARKPYVLTLHGGNLPSLVTRAPRRVGRLLAGAVAVTAPSRYLADAVRALRADVQVLPNPIDIGAYPFAVRRTPRPALAWLRAFHEVYDPALAIRVAARLAPEFPDLTLTMTGPDKDGSAARVRDEAERLGIADRVRILGPVPKADVPGRLSEGDVFLNTTTVDNTPVSVVEAMACGLCVVSTNVGGIPHLLDDGRDALLVPPQDEPAMAGAVRQVLTSPRFAERLSRAGREKAEGLSWERVLPRWEQLLRQVARSGHGQGGQAHHA